MMQDDDDDDDDDDDNDDPMILNNRAKNHTSERTIVPWTVIFKIGLGNLTQVTRDLFIMFQVLLNNRFNSVGDNRLDSHSPAADERLSAVQDRRLGFKPGKRNI